METLHTPSASGPLFQLPSSLRTDGVSLAFSERMSEAGLLLDAEGRVTYANPVFAKLMGTSAAELTGRAMAELLAEGPSALGRLLSRAQAGSCREELTLRGAGGRLIPVLLSVSRASPAGVCVVAIDLTDAKQAESELRAELTKNEKVLDRLLESSRDCVQLLSLEGEFLYINAACRQVLKVDRLEGLPHSNWLDCWHGEGREAAQAALSAARAGQNGRFLGFCPTVPAEEGSWWDILLSPIPGLDGAPERILSIARDVSEPKRAEAELHEAVRARDNFLKIASHELKTPLTTLKLQAQMRRLQVDQLDQCGEPALTLSAAKRWLDRDEKQADRLARLVDDMLDISRIQVGKFSLQLDRMDLSELVSEVVEAFRGQASLAKCEMNCRLHPSLAGDWDRDRLEQVLANLLNNAFKYGRGTPIEITTAQHQDAQGGLWAELKVRDQGPGIAPADQRRIFERFERAVERQDIKGLGLGLYIVKEIVESHRGTIAVESELRRGACFTMRLPLATQLT